MDTYKKAIPAYDFLDMKASDGILNITRVSAIVGHNRAATKGGVNSRNAHPFTHGNITLVHNGTLTNHYSLEGTHSTDSESICFNFHKNGVLETLEKLEGSYSLVWINEEDGTVNFARNDERPMCMVEVDEGVVLFASEAWMLVGACSEPFKVPLSFKDKVEYLEKGKWISVPVNGENIISTPFKIAETPLYNGWNYGNSYRTGKDVVPASPVVTSVGEGSMLKLGISKGDTILFLAEKLGAPYAKSDKCSIFGSVVSNLQTIPNIKVTGFQVEVKAMKAVMQRGLVVMSGVVTQDSFNTKDAINVANVIPICGKKRLEKKKLPRRLDGVEKAKEEWDIILAEVEEKDASAKIYYDHSGKEITLEEFKEIAKGGCGYCSHPIAEGTDDYEYYGEEVMHSVCFDIFEDELIGVPKGGKH